MAQSTKNSREIKAPPAIIYAALTDPEALETWQAPDNMAAKVHHFDLRVDGGYEMSLFYTETNNDVKGKTNDKEDRYSATFIELAPNEKIVAAIRFDSTDPDLQQEMTMEITLTPVAGATRVTFSFTNIPVAIKPEDNEAGTISTLEKLAGFVEKKAV